MLCEDGITGCPTEIPSYILPGQPTWGSLVLSLITSEVFICSLTQVCACGVLWAPCCTGHLETHLHSLSSGTLEGPLEEDGEEIYKVNEAQFPGFSLLLERLKRSKDWGS